jgi:hypothetical protein
MAEQEREQQEKQKKPPQDGVLRIYPPRGGEHEQILVEATRFYARGDFRGARRNARKVLAVQHSAEEGDFAEELLRRTSNDPVALLVALGCFGLFWLVIYLTVWR